MKRTILFLTGFFLVTSLSAQTNIIKGELTVFNQYPVANLEVSAKKAKKSVITDAQGNFELICNEKDIVFISDKVFQSVSKRVNRNDDFITINLIFKNTPKNRETATSSGYISEEDLAYALENLQSENNDFCNYSDVFSLIKGKFSDVDIRTGSTGEQGVYVRRGQKSMFGENKALYVVDGIRVNDISSRSPCEMASIHILKDAAAARYGAGASNGVVVIETKGAR